MYDVKNLPDSNAFNTVVLNDVFNEYSKELESISCYIRWKFILQCSH